MVDWDRSLKSSLGVLSSHLQVDESEKISEINLGLPLGFHSLTVTYCITGSSVYV